jgi:RNA polymerase sigma-70 factor, ECF subfamily
MNTTSGTLLARLRRPDDQVAWDRFVRLYTPLLYAWADRAGLPDADIADLVQDTFAMLLHKLPDFEYDCQRSFRGWLRTVLLNKLRENQRRRAPESCRSSNALLDELPAPAGEGFDDIEYRHHLLQTALDLVRVDFEPTTWSAWLAYAVAGRPAAEVAQELGLTTHAVYLVKARVLRRLRQELDGLLD